MGAHAVLLARFTRDDIQEGQKRAVNTHRSEQKLTLPNAHRHPLHDRDAGFFEPAAWRASGLAGGSREHWHTGAAYLNFSEGTTPTAGTKDNASGFVNNEQRVVLGTTAAGNRDQRNSSQMIAAANPDARRELCSLSKDGWLVLSLDDSAACAMIVRAAVESPTNRGHQQWRVVSMATREERWTVGPDDSTGLTDSTELAPLHQQPAQQQELSATDVYERPQHGAVLMDNVTHAHLVET